METLELFCSSLLDKNCRGHLTHLSSFVYWKYINSFFFLWLTSTVGTATVRCIKLKKLIYFVHFFAILGESLNCIEVEIFDNFSKKNWKVNWKLSFWMRQESALFLKKSALFQRESALERCLFFALNFSFQALFRDFQVINSTESEQISAECLWDVNRGLFSPRIWYCKIRTDAEILEIVGCALLYAILEDEAQVYLINSDGLIIFAMKNFYRAYLWVWLTVYFSLFFSIELWKNITEPMK